MGVLSPWENKPDNNNETKLVLTPDSPEYDLFLWL